jgi:hypothetical protein
MARALRLAMFALPVIASVASVIVISRLVERPPRILETVLWWIGITAIATGVMVVTDRCIRRLLPIAALFELSLVFPDQAPSRFKLALRSGTVKQFERKLEAGQVPTTQDAAETLLGLSAQLGSHDRLTRGHSERVRAYTNVIAEEMGLSDEERNKLHWSALLHDIGKLTVPPEILNKAGRPSDEEWKILQQHPAAAEPFLEPLADWLGEWRLAATQHHERWDGTGYPKALAGSEISLAGRIVAVADAFDTITSVRSYKKGMAPADARAELARCSGTQFDPAVVRAFMAVSLGKLRLVAGPLAWLAHSPILGSVPAAGSAVTSTVMAGAMTATMVAGGVAPLSPAEPDVAASTVVSVEDLPFRIVSDEDLALKPTLLPRATPTPRADAGLTPTPTPPRGEEPKPTPADRMAPDGPLPTPTRRGPTPTMPPSPTTPPSTKATPTPTPTPTPKPAPTPTPIPAAPLSLKLYLTNPGSSDTMSSPVLAMTTSYPTGSTLPNYDTDRDADAGLLLLRGMGVDDADPTRRQYWTANVGAADLPGTAQLKVGVSTIDFAPGSGELQVSLARCDLGLTSCETLGTSDRPFAQGGGSNFKWLSVNVNLSGGPSTERPVLRLAVAPSSASAADLWLAYGTANWWSFLSVNFG